MASLVTVISSCYAIFAGTQPLAIALRPQIRLVFEANPTDRSVTALRHSGAINVVIIFPARETFTTVLTFTHALAWKPFACPTPCKPTSSLFFRLMAIAHTVISRQKVCQGDANSTFHTEADADFFVPFLVCTFCLSHCSDADSVPTQTRDGRP